MNTTILDLTKRYRPRDAYIHPKQSGKGSACRFELHPAHEDKTGSIVLEIAMQKTIGGVPGHEFPTFDWENKLIVKLGRTDLSQILQVLNGVQESIAEGKGLFHRTARANTFIKFNHQLEPKPGYMLSVYRKSAEGEARSAWFYFDMDEAYTLKLIFEQSMLYVCFGIPEVMNRTQLQTIPAPVQVPYVAQQQMPYVAQKQVPYVAPAQFAPAAIPAVDEAEPMLKASGDPF